MKYQLTRSISIPKIKKFGVDLEIYQNISNCGFVLVETEDGHNQEFYNTQSSFNYVVLEGAGTFFVDDESVSVQKGDLISIKPNTRIYYKGKLKMLLITNPPWRAEDEFETRALVW